jgi:hypothetical protein
MYVYVNKVTRANIGAYWRLDMCACKWCDTCTDWRLDIWVCVNEVTSVGFILYILDTVVLIDVSAAVGVALALSVAANIKST